MSAALAASPQTSGFQRYPPLSIVCWLPPLAAILYGLLTVERAWSRNHATISITAVLPPLGQRCGRVCLNSFGNRTSPSDNSNDHWKRSSLVSRAAAPCVWTLRALTGNLLTYSLTLFNCVRVYVHPRHLQLCSQFCSVSHKQVVNT